MLLVVPSASLSLGLGLFVMLCPLTKTTWTLLAFLRYGGRVHCMVWMYTDNYPKPDSVKLVFCPPCLKVAVAVRIISELAITENTSSHKQQLSQKI